VRRLYYRADDQIWKQSGDKRYAQWIAMRDERLKKEAGTKPAH